MNQPKIHIRPAEEGVQVRMPDGTVLPEEGAFVDRTTYWVRMLNRGEVILTKDTPKSAQPKARRVSKEA